MSNNILTQDELKRNLHYSPDTGIFTRLVSRSGCTLGDAAGWINSEGYLHICINGKTHKAHRLAWLYVHGEFPDDVLDHISGIRNDNRIDNLREATQAQNSQNQIKPRVNNKAGVLGVCWHKATKKWSASIMTNYKQKHLGLFATPELAHEAYLTAKRIHHEFCTI